MGEDVVLAHGTSRAFKLSKGQRLRITTLEGGQVVDLCFKDFNQALSRDLNGIKRFDFPKLVSTLDEGMALYDGAGEAVLTLVENHTEAPHDLLFPGCRSKIYEGELDGCRDMLASVLDIPLAALPPTATFFMFVDEDMALTIHKTAAKGDHVVLRAERDVTVGLSACPDRHWCNPNPSDIKVEVLGPN